jgi:hypothetical protein
MNVFIVKYAGVIDSLSAYELKNMPHQRQLA